jgi:hypothetical protein
LELLEAVGRLKPASIAGDEADCSHGCAEELRGQARDTVEMGIGRRIENAAAIKSGKAQVLGQSSGHS